MKTNSYFIGAFICLCSTFILSACGLLHSKTDNVAISPETDSTEVASPLDENTPQPPLSITVCQDETQCPPVVLLDDLISRNVEPGTYQVSIPYDKPVRVRVMWWTANPSNMVDNLPHIRWIFEIDGQDYFTSDMLVQYLAPYDEVNKTQADCVSITADLDGWKLNEPHTIRIGFILNETVNDGWQDNPAGFNQIYIYDVTPVEP